MIYGRTGTDLDDIVRVIQTDVRMNRRFSDRDLEDGARAASGLNDMIMQGARATGALNDGRITSNDVHEINDWIRGSDFRLNQYNNLRDDFDQVDGQYTQTRVMGKCIVNKVADHIYDIGAPTGGRYDNRFVSEDNAYVAHVANYLDELIFG